MPVGQEFFEFLLGVRGLLAVEVGIDVGVDRRQSELLRLLQHDLAGDQAAQKIQLLRHDDVGVGRRRLLRGLRGVDFLQFGGGDGVAVHLGRHPAGGDFLHDTSKNAASAATKTAE